MDTCFCNTSMKKYTSFQSISNYNKKFRKDKQNKNVNNSSKNVNNSSNYVNNSSNDVNNSSNDVNNSSNDVNNSSNKYIELILLLLIIKLLLNSSQTFNYLF